jgi:hypothetical protein
MRVSPNFANDSRFLAANDNGERGNDDEEKVDVDRGKYTRRTTKFRTKIATITKKIIRINSAAFISLYVRGTRLHRNTCAMSYSFEDRITCNNKEITTDFLPQLSIGILSARDQVRQETKNQN